MAKKKGYSKALRGVQTHAKLLTGKPAAAAAGREAQARAIIEPYMPEDKVRIETAQFIKVPAVSEQPFLENISPRIWYLSSLGIMAVAIVLRLLFLTLKPFHNDEGVNGFFLTPLFHDGVYKYDPTNYHGPSLYYFALVSSYIFGLNDFAVRFSTAFFGILTVWLVFSLRRYLGTIGTLFAATLVALSPGLTYISRYFIHEILLVFFTLAAVVCVLKFWEGSMPNRVAIGAMSILLFVCLLPVALQASLSVGGDNQVSQYVWRFVLVAGALAAVYLAMRKLLQWDNGRPLFLLLAAGSAAMTFATKETAFISFGTMLIAFVCIWWWLRNTTVAKIGGIKIRRNVLLALFAGVLVLAIYFKGEFGGGYLWFYNAYLVNAARREQPLVLIAIIALCIGSILVWRRYFVETWQTAPVEPTFDEPQNLTYRIFAERLNQSQNTSALMFLCLLIFAFVNVVFFSSFFTYEKGVSAAFEAYNVWTKTGSQDHAQNGTWAYLKWLLAADAPLLILGALGALIALWRAQHRFALFVALWAFGLFAAYTLIPYKTPWIAINFVLPMGLIAGYGINELAVSGRQWQRTAAKFLAALGISICVYQTIELNFFRYDDEQRPYVYVHTLRSMNEMKREIEGISERAGTGKQAIIVSTSPDYWPLPWTMREFKGVGFYGQMTTVPNAAVIIGSAGQAAELEKNYSATHRRAGTYTLRPGVDLLLYVRNDLAQK